MIAEWKVAVFSGHKTVDGERFYFWVKVLQDPLKIRQETLFCELPARK